MKNLFLFFHKNTLVLITIMVVLTIALSLLLIAKQSNPTPQSKPTPFPILIKSISPLQKTEIGKTNKAQVQELSNVINKEASSDGSIKFTLKSDVSPRNDQIVVRNDVVLIEKRSLPLRPGNLGYTTISGMISEYGKPEEVIASTLNYGPFSSSYIYASRGFAFIGNPNNDGVFEMQFFYPTSIEEYIRQYGDEIGPSKQAPE